MKPKNPPPPSAVQLNALSQAAEHGGRLERWAGGYWTWPGCPVRTSGMEKGQAPAWSVATGTMRAMESRGWIARTHTHPEEWRDVRELTAAGREVLAAHWCASCAKAAEALADISRWPGAPFHLLQVRLTPAQRDAVERARCAHFGDADGASGRNPRMPSEIAPELGYTPGKAGLAAYVAAYARASCKHPACLRSRGCEVSSIAAHIDAPPVPRGPAGELTGSSGTYAAAPEQIRINRADWLDELCELISLSGLRVTFDAERNCMAPCWICQDKTAPARSLVVLGHYIQRDREPMSRPVCEVCLAMLPGDLAKKNT